MQKARPGAIRTGGSSVGTGVLDGPLFYRRGDSRIARKGPHPTARTGGHLPPGEGFEKTISNPRCSSSCTGDFRYLGLLYQYFCGIFWKETLRFEGTHYE